jgi:hypothetical protein
MIYLGDTRNTFGVSPTHPMHIEPDQNPILKTRKERSKHNLTPEIEGSSSL